MSDIAIKVEGLSKQYRIGKRAPYKTLRESLTGLATAPLRHLGLLTHPESAEGETSFWALKDVSFEIKKGEAVGIIGRNGAGKSTLLKILSRITEPTEGQIRIKGRVGSLLEVGTGFHPELTGRENVYLNGAILGMARGEIAKKFDEMVAFSEVEKFLDTPVKHYSSGMYMRLAFAVAAHLEPEILVVDEVLAVGDAQFQKKCLGKMGDVAKQGRTVLFVSHNMTAVQTLCQNAIMLAKGQVCNQGPVAPVIRSYMADMAPRDRDVNWAKPDDAPGTSALRIKRISITPEEAGDGNHGLLTMQSPVRVDTEFWSREPKAKLHITYHLLNDQGITVLTSGSPSAKRENGTYCATFTLPGNLLNSGGYFLKLLIVEDESRVVFQRDAIASFEVIEATAREKAYMGRELGVVQPPLVWNIWPANVSGQVRERNSQP